MTRDELIAALGRAEGPSRELDAGIFWVIKPALHKVGPYEEYLTADVARRAPSYTSSIDAALALVPEGWLDDINAEMGLGEWSRRAPRFIERDGKQKPFRPPLALWTLANGDLNNPKTKQVTGRHDTPALALCIAALKARQP